MGQLVFEVKYKGDQGMASEADGAQRISHCILAHALVLGAVSRGAKRCKTQSGPNLAHYSQRILSSRNQSPNDFSMAKLESYPKLKYNFVGSGCED